MNYTTTRCEAHITLKKGRIKEYGSNRSVHLKDGQEFEIELFNPHKKSVLAKILINGLSIGGGGIVLRPGQRTHLERYLDDNRKFKFNTYTVENSHEAAAAIANNGEVEVQFFFEQDPPICYNYNDLYKQNLWTNPWNGGTGGNPYYGGVITTSYSTNNFVGKASSDFSDGSNLKSFSSGNQDAVNCFFSNTSLKSQPISNKLTAQSAKLKDIETGRIEKGSNSSQSFVTVDMDFNSWASENVSLKLLPFSQKPIEATEIRNYCPNCGSRVKKTTWICCPNCGEDLRS
jgi:hypothetical protein